MNADIEPGRGVPRYLFPQRQLRARPYIPPVLLHLLIAILGAGVGLASFYLLRKLGF